MKVTKEELSLKEGLTKEWVITNGIGGFAASTVIGANTRKYHGLLVAPLTPPARRHLVFSKVDEAIEKNGKIYPLYTNIGKEYTSEGYHYLIEFKKEYMPKYTYQVEDTIIEKTICMDYGKNTVGILYHIKNGKDASKMTLAPLVNFRDFHTMSTNHEFEVKQEIKGQKVKMIVDEFSDFSLYMNVSEGNYKPHKKDTFYHMFYLEEEKRGFYPEENHSVVGVYEIQILPEEEKIVSFVFSMEENIEEIRVEDLIQKETKRLNAVISQTEIIPKKRKSDLSKKEIKQNEIMKQYLIAADSFIVYRPNFGLHTIIAGYPWFLDWGRDSLISFEGLLLVTKRYDLAKEVLLTLTKDIKFGLVPNGYSGYDNRPLYNSVDSSLLLFEQVAKYVRYTLDYRFIKDNLYEVLKKVIHSYQNRIDLDDNNIYLDSDGLLVSGTEATQNTWMDAKVGGKAVTPRNGKAVEINSMWYNALSVMEQLANMFEEKQLAEEYEKLAQKCKRAFTRKFVNKEKSCLYDVLGDDKIRPNQLFSISLSYPVLKPSSKIASEMFQTVTKNLLNRYGLKTLAKGEENYIEIYEGDSFKRDMSYHQGITWPWLLGIYYDGLKNRIKYEKSEKKKEELRKQLEKFIQNTTKTFEKEIEQRGCLGSIAEIYDSKTPYLPKGAFSQAWSIAEVLRIIIGDEKENANIRD